MIMLCSNRDNWCYNTSCVANKWLNTAVSRKVVSQTRKSIRDNVKSYYGLNGGFMIV